MQITSNLICFQCCRKTPSGIWHRVCATLSVSLRCVVVFISCFDDLLSIHFNGMREFVKPNETEIQSFNAIEMRIRFRALGRKTRWITYSYGCVYFRVVMLLVSCWIIAWNEWHQTKKCIFLFANWNYVSFYSYCYWYHIRLGSSLCRLFPPCNFWN